MFRHHQVLNLSIGLVCIFLTIHLFLTYARNGFRINVSNVDYVKL